jgi:hypothetical protein
MTGIVKAPREIERVQQEKKTGSRGRIVEVAMQRGG